MSEPGALEATFIAAGPEAIRARLRELLNRYSQAEIARRTGTPTSNVCRYLGDARVPADFCGAVIAGFGVNPTWLMTGEGAPYMSDITAGTAKMAGDLVELVKALEAVARKRLGAVAGNPQGRLLRDLNDALEDYETLRERLNTTTKPIFASLLNEFSRALSDDGSRAGEIRRVAAQISRLCDDAALRQRFDAMQGAYEQTYGQAPLAIDFLRGAFLRHIPASSRLDQQSCVHAHNFVTALFREGYLQEARRVCRAAMALIGEEGEKFGDPYFSLALHDGLTDIELGELEPGLAKIQRAFARLSLEQQDARTSVLLRALLLAGVMTARQAMELGSDTTGKAQVVLSIAVMQEDIPTVEAVIERFERVMAASSWSGFAYARALVRIAARKDRPALKEFLDTGPEMEPQPGHARLHYVHGLSACHLALLSGDKTRAAKYFAMARGALALQPEDWSPSITLAARYNRCALDVLPGKTMEDKALMAAARRFFDEHLASGYRCFDRLKPGGGTANEPPVNADKD